MDVDKEKVSQHGAHLRLGFGLEKLEKDRHAFPHRLLRKRNVQGAADKYLVVAVASEVRSLEDTGLHTRTEKRLIPPRQRLAEDRARVFALDDAYETFLDELMGLKISARCHGIAGSVIFLVAVRIPASIANLFDESGGDAITLYGEGVIGVRDVTSLDVLEKRVDILRSTGRRRKRRCNLFPHAGPHQAQPLHVGRFGSSAGQHGGERLLERIDFIDDMAG